MNINWQEKLQSELKKEFGGEKASLLAKEYANAFPRSYCDDYPAAQAANDISYLEKLSNTNPIEIDFYPAKEKYDVPLRLRFFQWGKPIPLSDILPMLENMDLRTFDESPYRLVFQKHAPIYISDFSVSYNRPLPDLKKVKELFRETFTKVYLGEAENDGFNKLVLGASLSYREVVIVRAYAKYLHQLGFRFTQSYIEDTLALHTEITRNLIQLFITLHRPQKSASRTKKTDQLRKKILEALDKITSLDEDKIIRRYLDLINATLRTNYFQTNKDKEFKPYLSFKINSRALPEMPQPVPLYEIFTYSTRFEAIHLRNTKVARGGIRWSDRREDFRTEILGLMKAQKVKNVVIVPSGSKGGFVLKMLSPKTSRDAIQKEVIACYKNFMRSLLD